MYPLWLYTSTWLEYYLTRLTLFCLLSFVKLMTHLGFDEKIFFKKEKKISNEKLDPTQKAMRKHERLKSKEEKQTKTKPVPRGRHYAHLKEQAEHQDGDKQRVIEKEKKIVQKNNEPVKRELKKILKITGKEKTKPKSKSIEMLETISNSFEIQLACSTCCPDSKRILSKQSVHKIHPCKENMILLKEKGKSKKSNGAVTLLEMGTSNGRIENCLQEDWIYVRSRPSTFTKDSDDQLCERFSKGEECVEKTRCPFPHNHIEVWLWKAEFDDHGYDVSGFVRDLGNSSLRVRYEALKFLQMCEGCIELVCSKCCNEQPPCYSMKSRHKPECVKGHSWNGAWYVALETDNGEGSYIPLTKTFDENEIVIPAIRYLKDIERDGIKLIELKNECDRLKREKMKKDVPQPLPQKKYDYSQRLKPLDEEILEYENEDMKNKHEQESFYEILVPEGNECDDDDDASNYDDEQNYYDVKPAHECHALLTEDPGNFRHCYIHLDGTQGAMCVPVDIEEDISNIEIRGRHNCGPTFEGDEVVVEIKDTEVLDEVEEDIKEHKEMHANVKKWKMETKREVAAKTVKRGRVVGIVKRGLVRKTYVFACTADAIFSHLMQPLCGTAPKIHVKHADLLTHKYKNNKDNLVAVYEEAGRRVKKIVKLNPTNRQDTIFVVKYKKWDNTDIYPKGIVIDAIPVTSELSRQQHILNILHQVPTRHKKETLEFLSERYPNNVIPEEFKEDRPDLTDMLTFTIDPEGCKDMDDALSFERIDEQTFEVIVHIADVSQFVDIDDPIDKEARLRGTSFYPADYHVKWEMEMLPRKLSHSLCSLVQGEERLTVSVRFILDINGKLIEGPDISRSIIKSDHKLTYIEAQLMLDDVNDITELAKGLRYLRIITQNMRRNREGKRYLLEELKDGDSHDTHKLIEELMIFTNQHVARFIKGSFPQGAPVRMQSAPREDELRIWGRKNASIIQKSFRFGHLKDEFKDRQNLIDKLTFTIDSEGCGSMNNALSLETLDQNQYEIIAHIADVSQLVEMDHSPELYSFEHEKQRFAVSVRFVLNKNGNLVEEADIRRSIVKSKHKLNYKDAQQLLVDHNNITDIAKELRLLGGIVQNMQKDIAGRLGPKEELIHNAKNMVEELMKFINNQVTSLVMKRFPYGGPFRMQQPESEDKLQFWVKEHENIFWKSSFFGQLTEVDWRVKNEKLPLLKTLWNELLNNKTNPNKLKSLLCLEEFHPMHALAMIDWYKVQQPAKYVCYEEDSDLDTSHYSLQMAEYNHFTSPMRRYMDLVVHRMLLAAIDGKDSPYSSTQIMAVCEKLNIIFKRSKSFGKACDVLKNAEILRNRPQMYPAYISAIENGKIQIHVPHLKGKSQPISLGNLDLREKPDEAEGKGQLIWEKRIYSGCGFNPHARTKYSPKIIMLDPNSNVTNIPSKALMDIQAILANKTCTKAQVQGIVHQLIEHVEMYNRNNEFLNDVTSEMKKGEQLVKHTCGFGLDIERGSVMSIQFGADVLHGLYRPNIRLLNLTPSVDVCLEHNSEPVKCFANRAIERMKRNTASYNNLEEYQEILLPILGMEAASTAIVDGDPILINNVRATLTKQNRVYYGQFQFTISFCKERQIPILPSFHEREEDSIDNFLCIRCPYQCPSKVKRFESSKSLWVGHAITTPADITEDMITVKFKIHGMNEEPPEDLIKEDGDENLGLECAVEFIIKSLPHKRMEQAVNRLSDPSTLCAAIIEGSKIPKLNPKVAEMCPNKLDLDIGQLPLNNYSQTSAIKNALTQSFTLIQGPPGTGKTLTGIKVAYWFAEINKYVPASEEGTKPQLMYCGPSNNAVDVATKMMREKLKDKCPKVVRVYSNAIEALDFPIPRDVGSRVKKLKRDLAHMADNKDVALHNLIRLKSNPYSNKIKRFDTKFKENMAHPEKVTDQEIEDYNKLIQTASIHEIKRHEVILCTCAASANDRVTRSANVRQIIIDECGMCMEPESIIPMLFHPSALQIVLIGDHKQLQPIVKNQIAKDLGLGVSLFERHSDRSKMLTVQYRMHEAICQFPSDQFYESKLITPDDIKKRKSREPFWRSYNTPIVFCHVEGAEKSQSITTADGHESSKSNTAERDHAVRIFTELVNRHGIPEKEVTILSQYKAQCSEISREIKKGDFFEANVNTVVASQGDEWDYVILSCVRSMQEYEIDKKPSEGWKKKNLGFITDHHQINVAITRARKGLIVVGNKKLLRCDAMWKSLIQHYYSLGCVVNAKDFPAPMSRPRVGGYLDKTRFDYKPDYNVFPKPKYRKY